ncbi:hypothetical protein RZQ58_29755 [Raoultella planticola]|uniref:hypothetical protein n=1 Tax=Raoultella planticola TaxID=575 RepID=UPI00292A9FB0|nr:hypothetical protein [Raoultella planticola]MDV1572971.1 hypothetical protein [Raoultella planticola]
MRAFYLEGSNITWLNVLCILFFVIGVVGALAMFVIPDKFNLRVCRAKEGANKFLI